jgi:hypothetical protein
LTPLKTDLFFCHATARLGSRLKWSGTVMSRDTKQHLREDPVLLFVLPCAWAGLVTIILMTDAWLLIRFSFNLPR